VAGGGGKHESITGLLRLSLDWTAWALLRLAV
jgi:hypothetical protein